MNKLVPLTPATREPQQGRSRASYERMLAAAEKLMIKRGNDEFTLTEVAKTGKVSIGSIYLRFDSKDDLMRAVHARVLTQIDADQAKALADVVAASVDLDDFTQRFVGFFAESLRSYSPALRPMMLRATYDAKLSGVGKESADRFGETVKQVFLKYSAEFARSDHKRLVDNAYRVIYATIARFLGLGSSPESANEGNWEELKQDLATMVAAFLKAPAPRA